MIFVISLLLMVNSLGLGLLRLALKKFSFHWLLTLGVAVVVWILAILGRASLPGEITLGEWQSPEMFIGTPGFILDEISWRLIVALTTLHLSTLLVGGQEAGSARWRRWAGISAYTAVGVLAVSAGNPLTLMMAWTWLDFLELIIYLFYISRDDQRQQVFRIIGVRLAGIFLVIAAGVYSSSGFAQLGFEHLGANVIYLVLIAAYLRLGIYPLAPPLFEDSSLRRSLGTIFRLVAASAALIPTLRVGPALQISGMGANWQAVWLIFTGSLAIYGGLAWFFSEDELTGRPGWVLGLASLSIAAAIGGMPASGLVWALALIFSGGLLFLADVRERMSRWVVLLGGIGLTMLPFTPSWDGFRIFTLPSLPSKVLYILTISALISGYFIKSNTASRGHPAEENWINIFYLSGLVLLPSTHFGLGIFQNVQRAESSFFSWFGRMAVLLLSFAGIYWRQRGGAAPRWMTSLLDAALSFRWLSALFRFSFSILNAIISFVSQLIEGKGGVLWAILWLVIITIFLIIGL